MNIGANGSSGGDAQRHATWRAQVRDFLDEEIDRSGLPLPLQEAIRYGSTAPEASRWRALLVLEVGCALGTPQRSLLPAAAGVEALHCATLSIDDLPSMDDATQRRGLPAMHRRFNEAMAIQASLWLLGASRTLMATAADAAGISVGAAARLSSFQQRVENELQLGQFMDMMGMLGKADVDVERIARLKCGRLFALAAGAAAWLLPESSATVTPSASLAAALDSFGEEVGLAYQILDDLEDSCEDQAAAGWSTADERGRPTVVARHGRVEAARLVERCTERARTALAPLTGAGIDCDRIGRIAATMLERA